MIQGAPDRGAERPEVPILAGPGRVVRRVELGAGVDVRDSPAPVDDEAGRSRRRVVALQYAFTGRG